MATTSVHVYHTWGKVEKISLGERILNLKKSRWDRQYCTDVTTSCTNIVRGLRGNRCGFLQTSDLGSLQTAPASPSSLITPPFPPPRHTHNQTNGSQMYEGESLCRQPTNANGTCLSVVCGLPSTVGIAIDALFRWWRIRGFSNLGTHPNAASTL